MKKLINSVLLMSVFAVSCNKTSLTPNDQSINITDLPAKAVSYVDNSYPDATISEALSVTESDASYIVVMNTSEQLAFDAAGNFIGDGENHHSDSRNGGKKDKHGKRGGHNNGREKHDGRHCDSTHQDSSYHHGRNHGHYLGIDSLNAAILGYIASNYAGYTLIHGELSEWCDLGTVTKVLVRQEGLEPISLFFDSSNTFLMSGKRDLYTNTPQVGKDYISSNYSGYTVRTKVLNLTMADTSIQYVIFLNNGSVFKMIRIKADGTFVCEK